LTRSTHKPLSSLWKVTRSMTQALQAFRASLTGMWRNHDDWV
jgi:hypothetical protein